MKSSKMIAIDFGGTTIKIATIENGIIIKRANLPAYSEKGLKARLKDTETAVFQLVGNKISTYQGIAIAMPGLVDSKLKRVTEIYEKYSDSLEMDFEAWSYEKFGLPLFMEQDSKAALIGEVLDGCAQGYKDALIIIIGTGVGTAVMINGRILDSHNHWAGSLGSHIIIDYKDGRNCTCGGKGCLEAYTSSYALEHAVKSNPQYSESGLKNETIINFEILKKWFDKRDIVAIETINEVADALQAGIISLVHAYDPSIVVLSGGALNFGETFTDAVLSGIEKKIWGKGKVKFVKAEHPEDSVLNGLYHLIFE